MSILFKSTLIGVLTAFSLAFFVSHSAFAGTQIVSDPKYDQLKSEIITVGGVKKYKIYNGGDRLIKFKNGDIWQVIEPKHTAIIPMPVEHSNNEEGMLRSGGGDVLFMCCKKVNNIEKCEFFPRRCH